MLNKVIKKFNYYEFVVFLFLLLIFTASFAVFIDTKSNKKIELFIYTIHERILNTVTSDFDSQIIYFKNISKDFENLPYLLEYDANIKFIIFKDGSIFSSNIGYDSNHFLSSLKQLENKGSFFANIDDKNIFGVATLMNGYNVVIFKELNLNDKSFSIYGEKIGIYDKYNNKIITEEYIDSKIFEKAYSINNLDEITIFQSKENVFSTKRFHGSDYYLFVYSPKSNYMTAIAKKGDKFTFTSFIFGFVFVVVLFFIKSFLSRYLAEKEKYEKLFQLEHEKFEKIVESITEGVCLIDKDYNIVWYNKYLNEMLGGFHQGKCFEILHGKDSKCDFCLLDNVSQKGVTESIQIENFLKDSIGHFEIVWSPIKNEENEIIAFVSVIKDITDSVRIQNEIIKSETYLKSIIYNSPEAILTFDKDFNVKTINNEALTILKLETKPDNLKNIFDNNLLSKISEKQNIRNFDCHLSLGEQNYLPAQVSVSKLTDELSDEYICVIKDMSKIKELEAQVIQSEKLSALGLLAGGVAHEINNPLVGILNMAQVLSKNLKDNSSKKIVDVIIDAGIETKKIVENLLSYARQNINKDEEFYILESIDFAIKILGSKIRNSKINIHKNVDSNLKVRGNKGKVHQIFLNLIGNAVDATTSGGNIHIKSLIEEGRYIIEIRDDGEGIDKTFLDKIFDPFFTTKPPGCGTGLGLSITLGIIKEHGWEIEVESEKGEFTLFRIMINEKI
ncbi:PAS domain-containing protein [Deferribacteraceae bacterium V6Fe1]|nr:PAS domain-containing protein [Deferribacteraceae bacterium V6Fe1]